MLGLFKLQGKKIAVHQPSILQNQPGWPQGGGRGHPGQVARCQEGLGERKKRVPKQKGADCPTGRGAKGTSEERNLEGAGQASAFSARAQ